MSRAPRQQQRESAPDERSENQQISIDQSAQARMKKLFELIRDRRPEIEAVLPPDIPYVKFEAVVNMAIRREPRLLETYAPSFIKACIQAAYDGLLPDGNQAVILYSNNKIPGSGEGNKARYRLEARYQSMVYGIRLKLVEAGAVIFIDAKVVFSQEHFIHEEGLDRILEHRPILDPEKRGDPIATYAIALLPDNTKVFDVLGFVDVMAAKEVAKTKNVWEGPFKFEMWKKTAIRRLSKAIPTAKPIRDAEAEDMFPQFAPQHAALAAPARPTRGDFAPQLEHRQEVPLDLGAFEGGYDTEESRQATRDKVEPETTKKRAAAKDLPVDDRQVDSRDQAPGSSAEPEEGDQGKRPADKAAYKPKILVPATPPADEDGWRYYADAVIESLPELKSVDEINAERRAHQDMIDQAPGAIGDQLADAFADAITDLV